MAKYAKTEYQPKHMASASMLIHFGLYNPNNIDTFRINIIQKHPFSPQMLTLYRVIDTLRIT